MSERERKPITIRFDKDLFEEADNYRVAEGMQKAEFFEEAVREYIDADRTARIESRTVGMDQKLDQILDALGEEPPTPSEQDTPKEKDSSEVSEEGQDGEVKPPSEAETEDGEWGGYTDEYLNQGPIDINGRQRSGKADRMFNYLMLKDITAIGDSEIDEAIETIVDEADTYFRGVYVSKIEDRIAEHGWVQHPLNGIWYKKSGTVDKAASRHWEDISKVLFDDESPAEVFTMDQLEKYTENRSDYHSLFVDTNMADRETVVKGMDMIEQEHKRRTSKSRRR